MSESAPLAAPPMPPAHPPAVPSQTSRGEWSLGEAVSLVILLVGLTIAAGMVVGLGGAAGLSGVPLTLVTAGVLVVSYVTVVAVVWLLARTHGSGLLSAIGARPVGLAVLLGGAVAITVLGRAAAMLWGLFVTWLGLDLSGMDTNPTALFDPGPVGTVLAVLIIVVVAPVAEEIVFRGVLLPALNDRWPAGWAVFVSSALFALIHVSPFTMVPVFVLALGLGWLMLRSRSLWVCIAAHAAFNASGLVLLLAVQTKGLT